MLSVSERSAHEWECFQDTDPGSASLGFGSGLTSRQSLVTSHSRSTSTVVRSNMNIHTMRTPHERSRVSSTVDGYPSSAGGGSTPQLLSASGGSTGNTMTSNNVTGFEVNKIMTMKGPADSAIASFPNSIFLHTFDEYGSSGGHVHQDMGIPSKPLNILYCIAGHKMYAHSVPTVDIRHARDAPHVSWPIPHTIGKIVYITTFSSAVYWNLLDLDFQIAHFILCISSQATEATEIKLAQSYFSDRSKAKLSRTRMQVTSAVLLPLRRLLLLGTEDGIIRVVS